MRIQRAISRVDPYNSITSDYVDFSAGLAKMGRLPTGCGSLPSLKQESVDSSNIGTTVATDTQANHSAFILWHGR